MHRHEKATPAPNILWGCNFLISFDRTNENAPILSRPTLIVTTASALRRVWVSRQVADKLGEWRDTKIRVGQVEYIGFEGTVQRKEWGKHQESCVHRQNGQIPPIVDRTRYGFPRLSYRYVFDNVRSTGKRQTDCEGKNVQTICARNSLIHPSFEAWHSLLHLGLQYLKDIALEATECRR